MRLTKFSKFLLSSLFFLFLISVIYVLLGITHITNTSKAIYNNHLIMDNGWYWFKPFSTIMIKNFPDTFDLFGDLKLQLKDGKIYQCSFIIKSEFDKNWILEHKTSPSITIPQYSLNSYVLDYVGTMCEADLFKSTTKTEIEDAIEAWLMQNINEQTGGNNGIIIKDVRIYTPFTPVQ